jgi:hypothetical protein
MVAENELQTFSAFEGKVSGNTIKGVSIIQEGPALGHGVHVDKTTLEQVKKLSVQKGKLKAKVDHWSGLEKTIGLFENFRVRAGKVVADLELYESHPGREWLLEMIEKAPETFGVSIMFRPDKPEYSKDDDRYYTRVREMYSADFVDAPAANATGVFDAQIDSGEDDMPAKSDTQPSADAFDAKAAIAALQTEVAALKTAFEAKPAEPAKAPEPEKPAETTGLASQVAELKALLKAFHAAPTPATPPAPANEPEEPKDEPQPETYEEARKKFIGDATGLSRTQRAMAFDQDPKVRPEHLR